MGVATVGAEAQVARAHGGGKPSGNRLLAEREMARTLDQVLQERVVGALLGLTDVALHAVHAQPQLFPDIVVEVRLARRRGRPALFLEHDGPSNGTSPARRNAPGGTIANRPGAAHPLLRKEPLREALLPCARGRARRVPRR